MENNIFRIYIDESGNTGEIKDNSFGNQPYFILAGIGLYDNQLVDLEKKVQELKIKYKIQAAELKARSLYNKPDFIHELTNLIYDNKYPVFIEFIDKKYYVVSTIVMWVLLKRVSDRITNEDCLSKKMNDFIREYSTILYYSLPDELLVLYSRICTSPTNENLYDFLDTLKDFFYNSGNIFDMRICLDVDYAIMKFEHISSSHINAYEHFMPRADIDSKGAQNRLLPHISSYTGICARVEKYRDFVGAKNIQFIHDEQSQYSEMLRNVINQLSQISSQKILWENQHVKYSISQTNDYQFQNSKSSIGIQISDMFAGITLRAWADYKNNKEIKYNKFLSTLQDFFICIHH